MEAFSDGVFAIAVTLLILDIGVSGTAGHDLLGAIRSLWPSYLAYVASFSTIGAAWLGHNAITEYLDRADAAFVRLNLLLLLVVSFLPFPTRLVAEFIRQDKAERVAVTFYGIVLVLATTMLLVLWRYAVRAKLVRPDLADEEVELLTQRLTPGLGGLPGPDRLRAVRPGHRRDRVPGHRGVLHHPVPALSAGFLVAGAAYKKHRRR